MRHAQEHWLRLQAQEAVMLANELNPKADDFLMQFSESDVNTLMSVYQEAKRNAATRLVEMELLHRRIVRLGGSV